MFGIDLNTQTVVIFLHIATRGRYHIIKAIYHIIYHIIYHQKHDMYCDGQPDELPGHHC